MNIFTHVHLIKLQKKVSISEPLQVVNMVGRVIWKILNKVNSNDSSVYRANVTASAEVME